MPKIKLTQKISSLENDSISYNNFCATTDIVHEYHVLHNLSAEIYVGVLHLIFSFMRKIKNFVSGPTSDIYFIFFLNHDAEFFSLA